MILRPWVDSRKILVRVCHFSNFKYFRRKLADEESQSLWTILQRSAKSGFKSSTTFRRCNISLNLIGCIMIWYVSSSEIWTNSGGRYTSNPLIEREERVLRYPEGRRLNRTNRIFQYSQGTWRVYSKRYNIETSTSELRQEGKGL